MATSRKSHLNPPAPGTPSASSAPVLDYPPPGAVATPSVPPSRAGTSYYGPGYSNVYPASYPTTGAYPGSPPNYGPAPGQAPLPLGNSGRLQAAASLLGRLLSGLDPSTPSGLTGSLIGLLRRPPSPHPAPSAPIPSGSLRLPGFRTYWLLYLIAGAVLFYTGIRIGTGVADLAGEKLTTLQYGDPRTTHLDAALGLPGETAINPTLMTAVNDRGTAHIFVLPGGHADKAFVLELPLPEDPDGRQPLQLTLFDSDRDGHPDLLVTLGNTGSTSVFLLDTGKGTLRPPTADEQRRLFLPGQTSP